MKVSIITTTYNSSHTIAETILSVLRQTYTDIEYWLIDGKSADNTLEIIQSFSDSFQGRLHYLSESDQGIYDAMNKGIALCSGDIVGILNSDDFFTSNDVVEKVVESFSDDIDAVYGDVHFVNAENTNKCIRYYSGRPFRPYMVKFGFIAPHPSFYIRKCVFDKYGLYCPDYKISGDFELIARFCHKHKIGIKYIHLDFVTMRVGGASTRSAQARLLGLKESITACRRLGVKTNRCMISCKYIIKIISSLLIRE